MRKDLGDISCKMGGEGVAGSSGPHTWPADDFSRREVGPSGFANRNLVSESNQNMCRTHTMCRMASTCRCCSWGISSSPVCTMRLKQEHIESLDSREIYVQKKVTDKNTLKIWSNWRHGKVTMCNIVSYVTPQYL